MWDDSSGFQHGKRATAVLLALWLAGAVAWAGPPTTNVIYRVLRTRSPAGTGSAFTIEVDGRQYLITARHNVKDLAAAGALELWIDGRWTPAAAARVFYPANGSVDIAALDLGRLVTLTFPLEPTSAGLTLGQQVYFLGYPFGMSTSGPPGFGEIPFLKSGIVSALDSRNPESAVLYVDGQNNPGFSGGPIVFWHAETGGFRVAGVVSGYRNEPLPVLRDKDLRDPNARAYNDLYTRANSGIVVGYDIKHIVEAIRAANRVSLPSRR
jgi:S1-C subfamily serine protease